ncbi:hypothetical protein [Nonomuraea salmonea]|uniref:hypothetical protein n=1 Tax=Nonomuraea salmonea TaxID=46181 RepID=UPI0031E680A8
MSPIGTTPVGLLHAAASVPNHLVSELQDLRPPLGVSVDLTIEDGAFVLGDAPPASASPSTRARSPRPRPARTAPPTYGRSGPGCGCADPPLIVRNHE